MKRSINLCGLVALSVFALSAGSGSTASGAEFHAATAPINISGNWTFIHRFTTMSGSVECTTAKFSGQMTSKTQSEITMTPTYENCEAFFFVNVPIDVNGCGYRFQANGTTEIECPSGKQIAITAPGCTTTIGPQHIASGMNYSNNAGKTDIIAKTNISGIKYNECGSDTNDGTYTGTTTITGAGSIWYE